MKIIRIRELVAMLGVSRVTLYRWDRERNNGFPTRIRLGAGIVGYVESEIQEWIASRPRGMAG